MVYKILRPAEWDSARKNAVFSGSPDDLRDGFIHLSTETQWRGTAARRFAGEESLVLLAFDAAAFVGELKWEVSRGGE